MRIADTGVPLHTCIWCDILRMLRICRVFAINLPQYAINMRWAQSTRTVLQTTMNDDTSRGRLGTAVEDTAAKVFAVC